MSNKKSRRIACGIFYSYSLDLLELSAFPAELPELSGLLELPELSAAPGELLPLSDALALAGADSLFSAFARLFNPEGDLWSVAYQPEPLNTIPAGVSTFRKLFLLHSGQRFRGSSLKD